MPREGTNLRRLAVAFWALLCAAGLLKGNLSAQTAVAGAGSIGGQLREANSGEPVVNASVLLIEPGADPSPYGDVLFEERTDADGRYLLEGVPVGSYTLRFLKVGFRPATLTDVTVEPGERTTWDFPLVEIPRESMDIFNLEEFVVSAEEISDEEYAFEVFREQSLLSVDLLTGADFSRFAAGDVAEAIKRIPGITVQEGKFAVIRGLNERYSSTLFNGAPVPSPDPDKQSIPLDLFPADIVSNLVVNKTFSPELPGNSAGGSLDIKTDLFPEAWTLSISAGTEWNTEAEDRYLDDGGRPRVEVDFGAPGSVENRETATNMISDIPALAPMEADVPESFSFSVEAGGAGNLFRDRKFRVRASLTDSRSHSSISGFEHDQFAVPGFNNRITPNFVLILDTGDLALRRLSASGGKFDFTESSKTEETSGLLNLEFDLDPDGAHRIHYTGFYIESSISRASLWENGFNPLIRERENLREPQNEIYDKLNGIFGGNFEFFQKARFWETNVVEEDREFEVHQVSGVHDFSHNSSGLSFSWMGSLASTGQTEYNSLSANGLELPNGTFKTGQDTEIGDYFRVTSSWRDTQEDQDFGKFDLSYEMGTGSSVTVEPFIGYNIESVERDIVQEFASYNLVDFRGFFIDDNPVGLPTIDAAIKDAVSQSAAIGLSSAVSLGEREVNSWYLGTRFKWLGVFEIAFGARIESLEMSTRTNSGEQFFNSDLLREPDGQIFLDARVNSTILGYGDPLPSDFVGIIDEDKVLPAINTTVNLTENLRLRGSYSKALVRPSFKEFTYLTVRNPINLEWESGNPKLIPSQTRSLDLRLEYFFGGSRDVLALSAFEKSVDHPIERTTLDATVETRIFFNNPNTAKVKGLELEVLKSLDFVSSMEWMRYFSVGANFTFISADVAVPDNFRKLLSGGLPLNSNTLLGGGFYARTEEDANGEGPFEEAPRSRPLFDQPEWIANASLRFDHPEWGTGVTLSYFAQGKTLDTAAGFIRSDNTAIPNIFRDSYNDLTLVITQRLWSYFTLKLAVENLTDSKRTLYYDEEMVDGGPVNREYRLGRTLSLSLTAKF